MQYKNKLQMIKEHEEKIGYTESDTQERIGLNSLAYKMLFEKVRTIEISN